MTQHPAHPPQEAPLVLSVSTGTRNGHQVLTVTGDLVGGTTELLRSQLSEARSTGDQHLLVDLTGIRSVDAVGLAVLVDAQHRSTPPNGCLHLVASSAITQLGTTTGLRRTLQPHPTPTAALPSCPHRTGTDQTRH